jgi:hypothetical protein
MIAFGNQTFGVAFGSTARYYAFASAPRRAEGRWRGRKPTSPRAKIHRRVFSRDF